MVESSGSIKNSRQNIFLRPAFAGAGQLRTLTAFAQVPATQSQINQFNESDIEDIVDVQYNTPKMPRHLTLEAQNQMTLNKFESSMWYLNEKTSCIVLLGET